MKKFATLLLVLNCLFCACKKDHIEYRNKFEKSYQTFQSFKQNSANSYSYIIYYGSVFGSYSETKMIVTNGEVTGREYKSGSYTPNTGTLNISSSWIETRSQLNTHPNGREPMTLDAIYAKAKSQWLNANTANNKIIFETENSGIISSCGYIPNGCMDDCFNGVQIKAVQAL